MVLWGGRFSAQISGDAWKFNSSLLIDQRLAMQDVTGTVAWVEALHTARVISDSEHAEILNGLATIREEFSSGKFVFVASDEDIHTAVERRLAELIGEIAGKLHTGRSRNDQVATDFRLWMLEMIPTINAALVRAQTALVRNAEAAGTILMPGYTHLQRAQPILLAHWWLSYFWPLERDRERFQSLISRVSVLPLGSGALAGTPVPLDRESLAKSLGFARASSNSLDAVSDRDFVAEFLFCVSMVGLHVSRLAEQMVLFLSAEFGFFELSDAFATGSSLMPQKKNPDVFELMRGKAGSLLGLLAGLLATLKGLPSTYDKDLQEDKAPVFQAADTVLAVIAVLESALGALTPRPERMEAAIDSTMMATDLADYLVEKGLPFRQAHAITGKAVVAALDQKTSLDHLEIEMYRALSPVFGEDVYHVLDSNESVRRRNAKGGTAPSAVKDQLAEIQRLLR